jgi:hydrogenase nickel incorporation protein HypA/HybF
MHETHLLKELLADVLKAAEKNDLKKVTKVHIKMGQFTEIDPEILRFYFKENTANTVAAAAELMIDLSPLRELRLLSIDGED